MDARPIVLAQFQMSHRFLGQIIDDCAPDLLTRPMPGNVASIGVIFAHTAIAEDYLVNVAGLERPMLYTSDGWQEKTRGPKVDRPEQNAAFAAAIAGSDMAAFLDYARAVFAATEHTIETEPDSVLDREAERPIFGKSSALAFIGGLGLYHVTEHSGEIAALKGVHGLKGLPF